MQGAALYVTAYQAKQHVIAVNCLYMLTRIQTIYSRNLQS
jgi:hypothetical protein